MPVIMCGYCEYLGNGKNETEMWEDVVRHENEIHRKELYDDGLLEEND